MTDCIQVLTTVERQDDAGRIAEAVLDKRLGACVQVIGPMTSYFHWQGKVETEAEFLVVIKSRRDLYDEIDALLHQIHPYEVPEVLALPVAAGGRGYLEWLAAELKG